MRFRIFMLGLVMLALGFGEVRSQAADEVLARIGGRVITRAEFEEEMVRRGAGLPGQYETSKQRRDLLDSMVRREALAVKAREAGYDRDPKVLEALERIIVSRFRQDVLEPKLEAVEVTDEEVAKFYDEHRDDYARPARIQVALVHIAVSSMASADKLAELEEKASTALEEAFALDASVRHFGAVARKYSDDRATRYTGGVIGWLNKDSRQKYKWDPAVLTAAFALEETGSIAPLIRTDDGFYLVRLVRREEAQARPLAALEDGLRHQLIKRKQDRIREEFLDELLSGLSIEVSESTFDAIRAPEPTTEPDRRPPSLPGR